MAIIRDKTYRLYEKDKLMEIEATQQIMFEVYRKVSSSYHELFQHKFGRLPSGLEDIPLYLETVWYYYQDNMLEASPTIVTANEILKMSQNHSLSGSWNESQRIQVEQYYNKIIDKFQNDMKIGR